MKSEIVVSLVDHVIASLDAARAVGYDHINLILAPQNEKPFKIELKQRLEEVESRVFKDIDEAHAYLKERGVFLNISLRGYMPKQRCLPVVTTDATGTTVFDTTRPPNPSTSHHDKIIEAIETEFQLAWNSNYPVHVVLYTKPGSLKVLHERAEGVKAKFDELLSELPLGELLKYNKFKIKLEVFQKPHPFETDETFLHIHGRNANNIFYEQE